MVSKSAKDFVDKPSHTLRWNYGERGSYFAAEVQAGRVLFFRWNHEHGQNEGKTVLGEQSAEDFLHRGPVLDVPASISKQLRDLLVVSNHFT